MSPAYSSEVALPENVFLLFFPVLSQVTFEIEFGVDRLGPRVKKKNGCPESSKVCYSINLNKYIWCIRNHCIANFLELHNATRANKVWQPMCSYACARLIQTLLSQQRVIKLKSNYLSGMTMCVF